jgi:general transcription factor 3C polypeptide 3 (transcription factor C subunit 4)
MQDDLPEEFLSWIDTVPDPQSSFFENTEYQDQFPLASLQDHIPKMTDIGGIMSSIVLEAKSSWEHEHSATTGPKFDEDSDSAYLSEETDLLIASARPKRKRTRKQKKFFKESFKGSSTVKLSPQAASIMGKANAAFVMRDYAAAIEGFLEVIRMSAKSHEPYHSLGLIYEETGEVEKAICFYFLAAQLAAQDVDLWKRLASMAKAVGKFDLVFYFMGRALKQEANEEYSQERISLAFACGYRKAAIRYSEFHAIHFPQNLQTIRELCNIYIYEFKDPNKALKVMQQVFDANEFTLHLLSFTHLNFLAELAYMLKDYSLLDQYISKYASRLCLLQQKQQLASEDLQEAALGVAQRLRETDPVEIMHLLQETLPFEIEAKWIIGKIYGGKQDIFNWLDDLKAKCAIEQEFAYLYLQIAHALLENQYFDQALMLYRHFLNDLPSVLLHIQLIECYIGLGELQEAIIHCKKALELDDSNDKVKLKLISLLQQTGQDQEANEMLATIGELGKQAEESDEEQEFLYASAFGKVRSEFYTEERCKENQLTLHKFKALLASSSQLPDVKETIYKLGITLVTDLFTNAFLVRNLSSSLKPFTARKIGFSFADVITNYNELFEEDDFVSRHIAQTSSQRATVGSHQNKELSALHGLSIDEWQQFLVEFCLFLTTGNSNANKYKEADRILQKASTINIFHFEPARKMFFKFFRLGIWIRSKEPDGIIQAAYSFFKYYASNDKSLALLISVAKCTQSTANLCQLFCSQKFAKRARRSSSSNSPNWLLLYANSCMLSGSFTYAIHYYEKAAELFTVARDSWKLQKCNFYLAIALLHRSMSRRVENKQFHLMRAFSLLFQQVVPSQEGNSNSAESLYNLARAFHFVGMLSHAVHYYEKALESCAYLNVNLKFRIGYNLHLIFVKSQNFNLAKKMLDLHCRIE